MDKKVLLFDFDGVIFDSFEGLFSLAQKYWDMTAEQYRAAHEGNIYEDMREMNAEDLREEERKLGRYFDEAGEAIAPTCPIFSGMRDALLQLSDRYQLFIVTSTPSPVVKKVLQRCGIESCFAGIYGLDIDRSKEKKIGMIFAQHHVVSEDCVFITDTLGDIREARKAGVEAIAVTWGFHERERLQKGDPWRIIETVQELVPAIDSYFNVLQ